MKKEPLFTVATITYNSSKWVRQTIESVLSSSFKDFEYLISDDCSTDCTWDIIQEYNDPRIISWRNEKNLGEYPNRNKILEHSRGRFILYIDGDDILYKDALFEYARFAQAFPEASAIWGVQIACFDFIVFPYLFKPAELTGLNYLSTYPITAIGFPESVFGTNELKEMGGFSNDFAIGDTYVKRKFSCLHNVLLVPTGRSFWRLHPDQASNKVKYFYRNLIDSHKMDKEILNSNYCPLINEDLEQAKKNLRIRTVKLIVLNTIRKGKFLDFFRLMKRLNISLRDVFLLTIKGDYSYKAGASIEKPVINNYHFKKD